MKRKRVVVGSLGLGENNLSSWLGRIICILSIVGFSIAPQRTLGQGSVAIEQGVGNFDLFDAYGVVDASFYWFGWGYRPQLGVIDQQVTINPGPIGFGLAVSNFAGPTFSVIPLPTGPFFDPGPPNNKTFADGISLTGAPITVSGTNQMASVVGGVTLRWWHWTAPADGVAELNAGPLYPSDNAVHPIPPTGYHYASSWPIISVGPDQVHLTNVQWLPFPELPSINWTTFPTGSPLDLPSDPAQWQHKFRFAVVAGETYHIALLSSAIRPYQFRIDLFPVGLVISIPTDDLLVGDSLPIRFLSSDTNKPVPSLEAFAGIESLGGLTVEPFQFFYSPSQAGVSAVYALGTNVYGERVVSIPTNVLFRPANDDFNHATVVSNALTKQSISGDTTAATAELGEPDIGTGIPATNSIWWRWTAPYGVQTTVTLYSTYSKLATYTGDDIASLVRISSVESAGPPLAVLPPQTISFPSASFLAEQGVTYYFQGEAGKTVSWNLDQQTLEIYPTGPQRGNVGWPIDLSAVFYETDGPPYQVDFMVQYQLHTSTTISPLIVESLGSFSAPPFFMSWVPTNSGFYGVFARSTNSEGVIHFTAKTSFAIYAGNDDFDRPTIIDPDTISTNFPFQISWASVETNEPLHRIGGPRVTRWWKWTPSYNGNVRVKAVRGQMGLPVEIFSGSSLSNLVLITDNNRKVSVTGLSGAIHLRVKAGRTYYIRTDEDPRALIPPPGFWVDDGSWQNTLTIEPVANDLAGEISSSLIAGYFKSKSGLVPIAMARVFQPDGQTLVSGLQYRAQLYVGKSSSDLSPAGDPSLFYPDSYSNDPRIYGGLYMPALVVLPDVKAGERVYAQVRVWDSNYGESFETAMANGSPVGQSKVIRVTTGSEETAPAMLLGIKSFNLQNPAP